MIRVRWTSFIRRVTGSRRSTSFFHFDCTTLIQLIKVVEDALPGEPQLFVVDYSTFEYHITAESQFLDAMEKSGALIIASDHEF
jgi:hypothetical protein